MAHPFRSSTFVRTFRVILYHRAYFQCCSSAGIIEGANDGRGRGKQGTYISNITAALLICFSHCRYALLLEPPRVTASINTITTVARTCNLIFIILDVLKPLGDKKVIEGELEGFGIRLNKRPPNITVRRKEKGGIAITNTVPLTNIDQDEIKAVLSEYKLNNCDVAIREPNATTDDIVDVIEGNRLASSGLLCHSLSLTITQSIYPSSLRSQ